MVKRNTAQEVLARIKKMQDSKTAELTAIESKQAEARTQLEAARLAIKDATERMDLKAYEKAKEDKRRAQTALDMYSGRYTQIQQQEYISEEDSDKVIASLLEYETQLAADFKQAVAEPLKALASVLQEYDTGVQETERALHIWQQDIHANYISAGTIYSETGTNRSPRPVPVHVLPYTGCDEAAQLGDYLKKAGSLYGN